MLINQVEEAHRKLAMWMADQKRNQRDFDDFYESFKVRFPFLPYSRGHLRGVWGAMNVD